jgi:hypothetical protein
MIKILYLGGDKFYKRFKACIRNSRGHGHDKIYFGYENYQNT